MQGVLNRYKRGIINININAGGVVVIDFHPNCVIIFCGNGIVHLNIARIPSGDNCSVEEMMKNGVVNNNRIDMHIEAGIG